MNALSNEYGETVSAWRALMNYLPVLNGHPPLVVYDEDKLAYYGALRVWDEEADLLPFADFLRAETVKTWRHGL